VRASGLRLDVLNLMVEVLAPGNHRRCTSDEDLRRWSKVTVGRTIVN
jgi:hypothetical protein